MTGVFRIFRSMKTKQHAATPWIMLGTALLLPLLLQYVSIALPRDGRFWGFDALAYLPPAWTVLLPAGALLGWALLRGMDIPPLRGSITLLLLLLALVPPLLWPVQTYFYGDGGLLIPQIHRFSVDGGFDADLLLNLKSAPLGGALLLLAMKAGPALGGLFSAFMPADALYPFRWLSALSLLAAALVIALTTRERQRLTLLVALGATAGALLYAGYVEYYAPVFAAITVTVVLAERALTGKGSAWPVYAAYAVAVAAHYLALALLPSMLFLAALRSETLRRRIAALRHADLRTGLAAGGLLIAAWIVAYFAGGFADSPSRIVMPITTQEGPAGVQAYTLLSSWHLADLLNLVALLAPAAAVALPWIWIARFRAKKFGDGVDAYHAMNVLLLGGFAFFANTSLGMARDWDLLAAFGIVLLLAALSALHRRYDERAALGLALVSLLLVQPWMQLHRDPPATAERFERLLDLDSGHIYADYALSGFDALRKYQHREGRLQEEIRLTKRMVALLDYPQHYRELSRMAQILRVSEADSTAALQQWMLGRLEARLETLQASGLTRDYSISVREIDSLTQAIGFLALGNGRYEQVQPLIDAIAKRTRDGSPYPAIAGLGFYQLGVYDVAADHLESAVREGFANAQVYLFLGNALALSRQYSASLSRFEEGVRLFPDDGMLRFTLGRYYVRAGIQPGRAAELLRWCLERRDPAEHADEAAALLRQLGAQQ